MLRTLSDVCNDCEGRGYTKSAMTVIYDIFRDIRRIGSTRGQQRIVVGANPRVVELLFEAEHVGVEQLEQEYHCRIVINADPMLSLEQYDILVVGAAAERMDVRVASRSA